jgi:hypothetical protein
MLEFFGSDYPEKISEYKVKKYESNINICIHKVYDVFFIKSICVDSLENITSLEINTNGQIIWKIPFDIIKTGNIKRINNKYLIELNQNIFGNGLSEHDHINDPNLYILKRTGILSLLIFNDINIKLNTTYDISYEIVIENVYIPLLARDKLSKQEYLILDINQYSGYKICKNILYILCPQIMSGIYIAISDKILKIRMSSHNLIFFEADQSEMDYIYQPIYVNKGWTINHSLAMYKSLHNILALDILNIIESYLKQQTSYVYYFAFDNIYTGNIKSKIEIHTENEYYDGSIYVVGKNILMHSQGSCVVRYAR